MTAGKQLLPTNSHPPHAPRPAVKPSRGAQGSRAIMSFKSFTACPRGALAMLFLTAAPPPPLPST